MLNLNIIAKKICMLYGIEIIPVSFMNLNETIGGTYVYTPKAGGFYEEDSGRIFINKKINWVMGELLDTLAHEIAHHYFISKSLIPISNHQHHLRHTNLTNEITRWLKKYYKTIWNNLYMELKESA